jgi:hypothetical protein
LKLAKRFAHFKNISLPIQPGPWLSLAFQELNHLPIHFSNTSLEKLGVVEQLFQKDPYNKPEKHVGIFQHMLQH